MIGIGAFAIHHRIERAARTLRQRQVLGLLHESNIAGGGPGIGIVADIHAAVLKAAQSQKYILELDNVCGVCGGTHGQHDGSGNGAQRAHVLQHGGDAEIAHTQVQRVGEPDGQLVPVADRQARRLRKDRFLKAATAGATLGAELQGVGRSRWTLENNRHERLRADIVNSRVGLSDETELSRTTTGRDRRLELEHRGGKERLARQ